MDPDRLTEDELAERSGTSRECIRQLADLRILQADDRGTFTRQDVMRARVVTDLHAMGIETEALATALASGHLTLGYLESAGRRHPRSDRTFAEVAKEIGVPFTTLERIYVAFGCSAPHGTNAFVKKIFKSSRSFPFSSAQVWKRVKCSGWRAFGVTVRVVSPSTCRTTSTPRSRSDSGGEGFATTRRSKRRSVRSAFARGARVKTSSDGCFDGTLRSS